MKTLVRVVAEFAVVCAITSAAIVFVAGSFIDHPNRAKVDAHATLGLAIIIAARQARAMPQPPNNDNP